VGSLLRVSTFALCSTIVIGCSSGGTASFTPQAEGLRFPASATSQSLTPDGLDATQSSGYKILASFMGSNGESPTGQLLYYRGNFYGTTMYGGDHAVGSVFRIDPRGHLTAIYSFKGPSSDGQLPVASLIEVNGRLYGTTAVGGRYNYGTVFELTLSGHERILHSFKGSPDAASPWAPLIYYKGLLYGVTIGGGVGSQGGTIFSVDLQGHERVLHSFTTAAGGTAPYAGLTPIGNDFYGTTAGGGLGFGTVFKTGPTGAVQVLYSFKGAPDAASPATQLVALNGELYGTAGGGAAHRGTVYEVAGTQERVIHSFTQKGVGPTGPTSLTVVNGILYGATYGPSPATRWGGTLYRITPWGDYTVLHSFGLGADGCKPEANPILENGKLYGTAESCGPKDFGIVYSIPL
jgi:uncharacterized repeat protein (TIGR03803 family)